MGLTDREKRFQMLVIDDFSNMRRTIKNMLRQIGFDRIMEAEDGDAALEKLEFSSVDFVICDWNMPKMPGINLLRAVRTKEKLKNIPFLMVTAENWEEEIVEAAEEQVDGYIIKPFVTKTLEEKIVDILERRKNPPKGEVIIKEGMAFLEQGMFEEALGSFAKILEMKPNSARALHLMSLVYIELKDMEKAEQALRKALEFNKQYVKGYQSLAEVLFEKGDIKGAIENIKKAISISPRIAYRQMLYGKLLTKDEQVDEAIAPFKKAVEFSIHPEEAKEEIREWVDSFGEEEKKKIIMGVGLNNGIA